MAPTSSDRSTGQVLLPETTPGRDTTCIRAPGFTDFMSPCRGKTGVFHATDKAASNLLVTSTLYLDFSEPRLREAHRGVGSYLAAELISEVVETEEALITNT